MTKIEKHKKMLELAAEFRKIADELWSKTDQLDFDAILERIAKKSMKQVRAEHEAQLQTELKTK
jgi:methylase of polypeptide subunit release factors